MIKKVNRDRDDQKFDKPYYLAFGGAIVFWVIVALVVALVMCLTSKAEAGGLLEVGRTEYKMPPNRLWWQDVDGYQINKDLTDSYIRVGYEFPVNKNLGVRLSAFSLGKYSLWAEVNTDEPCIVKYGTGAKSKCGPSEAVETRGSIKGLGVSLVARSSGEFRIFGELGYTYNIQKFSLHQCSLCFDIENTYNETLSGGGSMLNVGVEYKNLMASVFLYSSNIGSGFDSGNYPSGTGDVYGIAIGWRF